MDDLIDLSISDLRKAEKGKEGSNKKVKILHKCISANTSAIGQYAAHTTNQLLSSSCETGAIQKKSISC